MKSICITGARKQDLGHITRILGQAGMQEGKTAKHDTPIDIEFWHQQVIASLLEETGELQPVKHPGRLWEQLASEIFVANVKSKVWGWAAPESTWLLDYWADFERRINFVLVCVTPEEMLASAMASGETITSIDALVADWQVHHQQMLRFYHRNPQRCILVNARDCIEHPDNLIRHCVNQWKLPLNPEFQPEPDQVAGESLAFHIARDFCRGFSDANSLQSELDSTILRFGEPHSDLAELPETIIANYRELRDRSAELTIQKTLAAQLERATTENEQVLTQIQTAKKQIDQLEVSLEQTEQQGKLLQTKCNDATHENELLLLQLHQTQEQLAKERDAQATLAAEHQTKIDELTKAKTTLHQEATQLRAAAAETAKRVPEAEFNAAKAKLKESEQENELLLLQLHQVQEELEHTFIKSQAQQGEHKKLAKELDTQANLAAERQKKIDELTKVKTTLDQETAKLKAAAAEATKRVPEAEFNAAQSKLGEADKNNALLKQQLQQVQQELERTLLKNKNQQGEHEKLAKERDTQASLAAERQKKIDELTKLKTTVDQEAAKLRAAAAETAKRVPETEFNASKAKLKESEQENELLLLQLHQVQEELEHYFLLHTDGQKLLKSAEERWQNMLRRNPDFVDYEFIEVSPDKEHASSKSSWRIKNLVAAGQTLPLIEFSTVIERGIGGYVFTRQANAKSALTRWPINASDNNEITIIPIGNTSNAAERVEVLQNLATADWDLLQILTRLLTKTLETPATPIPSEVPAESLRQGLIQLGDVFAKLPATFRYDRVSLKREQVNPDYEHLWLNIENPGFGHHRWPAFEFRLSCANVRPDRFGTHPKLEFPEESSQAPFEGWFKESLDDFGAKLELRFCLPDSMDLDVWQKISERDRAFLGSLLKRLPNILGILESNGVKLSGRPWKDWQAMVRDMQTIHALRTTPPKKATNAEHPIKTTAHRRSK